MSRLGEIEHIVVLMMENRSFDHMLGFLTIEQGRSDVEGPTGNEVNHWNDQPFMLKPLARVVPHDPLHWWPDVAEQIGSGEMDGFVANYMRKYHAQGAKPHDVMSYQRASAVSMYDFFAREYCICDHWFCAMPGPTWPNRLFTLAGSSYGVRTHDWPPLPGFHMPSIFDYLTQRRIDWRYYHHGAPFFIFFARAADHVKKIVLLEWPENDFVDRVKKGELPAVTFIDPDFEDVLGGGNDDHAPADTARGQELIWRIYDTLSRGPAWRSTMLVVTYDEHGGFYDHVKPEPSVDEEGGIPDRGPRVPSFVVSPWVGRASVRSGFFDHTSILKTIILRFFPDAANFRMTSRVSAAADLGITLNAAEPRLKVPPPSPVLPPPMILKRIEVVREPSADDALIAEAKRRWKALGGG
jgi:phospholipase C